MVVQSWGGRNVRASYRSELSAITLAEGSKTSWVQALKQGSYKHPIFGEITIDSTRALRFADNANRGVRGIAMDIDYDHKARRDDAAGWVVQTEARPDGVWYLVEWTDEAADKIRNKQYRYFSAEFADEWTHPETGTTYSDVLFGGGLTNRPFIKGMVPVNLSESEAAEALRLTEEDPASTGDGGATEGGTVSLDLTAIRTALKLSEGTSDEAVVEAVVAKLAEPVTAPEPPADLTQLAETDPRVRALMEKAAESDKRLAEMETAMRLQEVRVALHDVDADTAIAITPAAKQLAEPLLAILPKTQRDQLVGLLRQFAEGKGTVKLGETGGTSPASRTDGTGGGDPVKKFTELVKKFETDDKLSTRQALAAAMEHDGGTLYQQYREATTAFKVVSS
jgi:phage I-like protein